MKVMRFPGKRVQRPTLDLHTVFETLSYMRDDLARDPDLKKVAEALDLTLTEISRAKQGELGSTPQWAPQKGGSLKPNTAKFIANRKR